MPPIRPGVPIILTEKEPETVNSSQFESILWREVDDEEYNRGQLIVRFQGSPVTVYKYNVEWEVFEKMAKCALKSESTELTPFKWYNKNMIHYVTDEMRNSSGGLYNDKLKLE